ncbi:MAG: hypothetical protein MUO62_15365 [Anaerolineales bacterium]|nr:hypothetical protein [Anaerolineales bacterium]
MNPADPRLPAYWLLKDSSKAIGDTGMTRAGADGPSPVLGEGLGWGLDPVGDSG